MVYMGCISHYMLRNHVHVLTSWICALYLKRVLKYLESLITVYCALFCTECPVCQEKYDPNEVISNLLLMKHHINLCESSKVSVSLEQGLA